MKIYLFQGHMLSNTMIIKLNDHCFAALLVVVCRNLRSGSTCDKLKNKLLAMIEITKSISPFHNYMKITSKTHFDHTDQENVSVCLE